MRDQYLHWLYGLVRSTRGGSGQCTFYLFSLLDRVEFYEIVPNDRDRGEDGLALRQEFANELGDGSILYVLDGPCTALEMMVALSRRMSTMMEEIVRDSSPGRWFQEMMRNLSLWRYLPDDAAAVEAIRRMVDRLYDADGNGGLFPLIMAEKDQRGEPLWNQMNEYMIENYYE